MLPSRIFFDTMLDDFKFDDKMKCDIYEEDGVYHVDADIPGFKKEDIKIEINKGNLVITAEKNSEDNEDNKKYIKRERVSSKYQRSFYLGEIDEENIDATFKHGTLKITIPKKVEEINKRIIEIK